MVRRLTLLSLFSLMFPVSAAAQMSDLSCDDSARLSDTLQNVIGATRTGSGLRDPDTMLEIWVTPHNSEWLIVQSYSNGTSCIVAMGEHWEGDLTGPA